MAEETILIADDHADIQVFLGHVFERENFRILHSYNGTETLLVAAEEHPDLILLDMRMTGGDGFEVIRKIRETDLDTAIILHTAFGTDEIGLAALKAGADDYLKKPVPLETLLERCHVVLTVKKGHNMLRHRADRQLKESEERHRKTAKDLAERMALLDVIHQIGHAMLSQLDLNGVCREVVEQVARIIPYDRASISLLEGDGEHLRIAALKTDGQTSVGAGKVFSLKGNMPDNLSEGAIVYYPNTEDIAEMSPLLRQLVEQEQILSMLLMPIKVRQRLIGTVNLGSRKVDAFNERHQEAARELLRLAAVAIDHARLYTVLKRSYASLLSAQAELVRQERLVALGKLSAAVAHEVRNPLGVMYNTLTTLRRLLAPTGDVETLLNIIQEEADHLNRVVGKMLDFARTGTSVTNELDPRDLVGEALRDAREDPGYSEKIRLECQFGHQVEKICLDPHFMRRALVNLLTNAFKSLWNKGGEVVVLTGEASKDGKGYFTLSVKDTGRGIDRENLESIFEPFFTTHATGTGLGLSIVKRIVEDHKGFITVDSEKGKGSLFTIHIPLSPPEE